MPDYMDLIGRRAVQKGSDNRRCTVAEVYTHPASHRVYVRLVPDDGPTFPVWLETFKSDWTMLAEVIPFRAAVVDLAEYRQKRVVRSAHSSDGGSAA